MSPNTTKARRNVDKAARAAREAAIAVEQSKLDREAEARENDKRVQALEAARAKRVAATVEAGATCVLTVNDGDSQTQITVRLSAVEPVARASARAALYALVNLAVLLESERISAAWIGGEGPMISKRLAVVLDGDEVRQAKR